MSSPPKPKFNRQELLQRLRDLGRKISTQTVFLHQALAQTVGLNATDAKCIDLILSHPLDSLTAGQLSRMTGLTTGAITHILDRLEKRRFIARVRDKQDRRKIFLRVNPKSLEPLLPHYELMGRDYIALANRYADKELQLICEYMTKASEIAERQLAEMVAAEGSLGASRSRPTGK